MGFALDTQETWKLVLWNDRSKEKSPALIFRYLSVRDTKRVATMLEEYNAALDITTVGEMLDKCIEALKVGLMGWENFPEPFTVEKIDAFLTPADCDEVCNRWLGEQSLSEYDKKKCARQSLSNTESSAAAVGVEANAPTAQQKPQPQK